MENNKTFSNPSVIINGDKVFVIPGSLKYDAGEGEINVRAVACGNNIRSVHSFNGETAISMVSMQVVITGDIDSKINEWKTNIGRNTISFSEDCIDGKPIVRVFPHMSVSASVERDTGSDQTTTVEFKGDRMFLS